MQEKCSEDGGEVKQGGSRHVKHTDMAYLMCLGWEGRYYCSGRGLSF